MVTQYAYTKIMELVNYDPIACEWTLPAYVFAGYEPDSVFRFSTRFAAHEFVYGELEKLG